MKYNFIDWVKDPSQIISEAAPTDRLHLTLLPCAASDLAPALGTATIDYHYNHLARAYVKRYNAGEGDPEFNRAGAYLHNLLFQQYKAHSTSNMPTGAVLQFIEDNFGSFGLFKKEFLRVAMTVQGSGWVYLSRKGDIKTIRNHTIVKDCVLIVDWWEHAWALDYQHDKESYLAQQWSIIDWAIVEARLA
jgi:Fe-Mn family superoxide dismutase